MSSVKMPVQFQAVAIVRRDSPAFAWFRHNSGKMRPGAILPVTHEEFESLKADVLHVRVEWPEGEQE